MPDITIDITQQTVALDISRPTLTLETPNAAPSNVVRKTDTDVSTYSWVLDEDNFASDSATKVPTQQSAKAYADALTTAAALLAKILTVDGAGSGLDADKVDGVDSSELLGFKNEIINGDGRWNQRAPASNADDTYGHDCHYVLTQTGAIAVSTLSAPSDGIAHMWRLSQSQASAQRMGYAQIFHSSRSYGMRGQTVTLGGDLRYSNAAAIQYAILEWTGTANSVTSDVVNDWTSGTYTAGNFFLGSNLTVTAVGSITPSAATVTEFSVSGTISSSANNIIVIMWTEGTAAQNSTLDARWYLSKGDLTGISGGFPSICYQAELERCLPFYRTSVPHGTTPADNVFSNRMAGFAPATTEIDVGIFEFSPPMAGTPTMTFYRSSQGSSAGNWAWYNGSSYVDATATAAADGAATTKGFSVAMTVSGATQFAAYITKGHWAAKYEL